MAHTANNSRRHFVALQCLGDSIHPAYHDTGKVDFDERPLHAALPAAIPLDDGRLKRNAHEAGHMERDISGGDSKVAVVMVTTIAPACLVAFVADRLSVSAFRNSLSGFLRYHEIIF